MGTQSGNVSDISFQTGYGTKRVTITTVPQPRARRVAVSEAHTATERICGLAEADGTRRAAQSALHISLLRSCIARFESRSLVPTHLSSSWSLYPFAHHAATSPSAFPLRPRAVVRMASPTTPPRRTISPVRDYMVTNAGRMSCRAAKCTWRYVVRNAARAKDHLLRCV